MPLGTPIRNVMIDDRQAWREKLLQTLQANYSRARNFESTMALVGPLLRWNESSLADFNIHAILTIASKLKISCRLTRQSELGVTGRATQLLGDLTKAVGAGVYLCGNGAGTYQDDAVFQQMGLELRYQDALQGRIGHTLRSGLSVIDYLMHDGRPLVEAFTGDRKLVTSCSG
jgi:hypothetical protein